ncbi:MAG: hypothetical protein GHHEDOFH_02881 [Pseudorhodoplanes sp.]|nr:hypothetical protein [Pseudorhodoplanes sp.]
MREIGEVGQDDGRVGAGIVLAAQFGERRRDVPAQQCVEQIDDARAVGEAEHFAHMIGLHGARGMGDRLVEQRERVAHRALRRARDHGERLGLDRDLLLVGDRLQMRDQKPALDATQVETLAARQHGDRNLPDFGCGEDELGVRRRLFQRLQERVKGRGRQHVHFVEDIDLVARRHRRVAHRIVDLADVVDAVMGGRVHFQHVDMPAFHDRRAMHAGLRHRDRRPRDRIVRQLVVQRARQDARGRGLADAAHAGQDPGLRDAPGGEGIGDGADHRLLPDQIVERGGTVFARQHAIGAGLRGHLGVHPNLLARTALGVAHPASGSAPPAAPATNRPVDTD